MRNPTCFLAKLSLLTVIMTLATTSVLADVDDVSALRNRLVGRLVGVEVVTRLIDIGEHDRFADLDRSRVRLLLAEDYLEECRLAGSVGAGDAHDLSGLKLETEILEEDPVSEALLQALDLQDFVAQFRSWR